MLKSEFNEHISLKELLKASKLSLNELNDMKDGETKNGVLAILNE
jgi:hypothetical protein